MQVGKAIPQKEQQLKSYVFKFQFINLALTLVEGLKVDTFGCLSVKPLMEAKIAHKRRTKILSQSKPIFN